jgi:hypothetical protein
MSTTKRISILIRASLSTKRVLPTKKKVKKIKKMKKKRTRTALTIKAMTKRISTFSTRLLLLAPTNRSLSAH